jgi:cytochrome c2
LPVFGLSRHNHPIPKMNISFCFSLMKTRTWGRLHALVLALGMLGSPLASQAQNPQGDMLQTMLGYSVGGGVDAGELLIGELNCTACHQADDSILQRLSSKQGPVLGFKGIQMTPQFIRNLLMHPASTGQARTMPDMLHGYENDEKTAIADALTHFLIDAQGVMSETPVAADPFRMQAGRRLFHEIGCVACHEPHQDPEALLQPELPEPESRLPGDLESTLGHSVLMGKLDSKTTVSELARFLKNPLETRPSGRMPSFQLSDSEATSLAMYLLRGQAKGLFGDGAGLQKTGGLQYSYLELGSPTAEPHGAVEDFIEHYPGNPPVSLHQSAHFVSSGITHELTDALKQRQEQIALVVSGYVSIPQEGEYIFYTNSDDGSRLYVGSDLVVNNDGDHGTTERNGKVQLKAGDHAIKVTYYNHGGPAGLSVYVEGPDLDKQPIPKAWLSHLGQPMLPTGEVTFVIDKTKASQGKAWFNKLGCASCHSISDSSATLIAAFEAKPLKDIEMRSDRGCLSDNPAVSEAFYYLSTSEKQAIASALSKKETWSQQLPPKQQVFKTMTTMNCFACHVRDELGGPSAYRKQFFRTAGEADMGDEGRFPPNLSGVGNKLNPEWMTKVLHEGASVRPYMATRMPVFGAENLHGLVNHFMETDQLTGGESTSEDISLEDAKYGRKLVGIGGMACITCHTFGKFGSLGIPAMDLTTVGERLQKDWFERYLKNPAMLRPGTRMPSFWPEGQSVNRDIFSGDTQRQIDSIWSYLNIADDNNPPTGLIQGQKEIVADREAVMYRNFIEGAGPRAIGVGYAEKANIAFDANQNRMAMIWQGPFMDGARHSSGRGAGFEPPLGHNLIKLPDGPPFSFSVDPKNTAWPKLSGKKAGYSFKGYWLDSKRRPKFKYCFMAMDVEDYSIAVPGELDAFLRRYLTFDSRAHYVNIWMRAATGQNIIKESDGSFLIDQKLRMRFELSGTEKPVIKGVEGAMELRVPVELDHGKAKIIQEIIW